MPTFMSSLRRTTHLGRCFGPMARTLAARVLTGAILSYLWCLACAILSSSPAIVYSGTLEYTLSNDCVVSRRSNRLSSHQQHMRIKNTGWPNPADCTCSGEDSEIFDGFNEVLADLMARELMPLLRWRIDSHGLSQSRPLPADRVWIVCKTSAGWPLEGLHCKGSFGNLNSGSSTDWALDGGVTAGVDKYGVPRVIPLDPKNLAFALLVTACVAVIHIHDVFRLVRRSVRRRRNRCTRCAYPMNGLRGSVCPECGLMFRTGLCPDPECGTNQVRDNP
jgi:hypothetical protein